MSTSERFDLMNEELTNAIAGFIRSLDIKFDKFNAEEIDTLKNGQVHKFIYCTELSWKTAKIYLEDQKGLIITAPKSVIKGLFTEQIIDEKTYLTLLEIINNRNALSHIYKEELFLNLLPILPKYALCMQLLLSKLNQ